MTLPFSPELPELNISANMALSKWNSGIRNICDMTLNMFLQTLQGRTGLEGKHGFQIDPSVVSGEPIRLNIIPRYVGQDVGGMWFRFGTKKFWIPKEDDPDHSPHIDFGTNATDETYATYIPFVSVVLKRNETSDTYVARDGLIVPLGNYDTVVSMSRGCFNVARLKNDGRLYEEDIHWHGGTGTSDNDEFFMFRQDNGECILVGGVKPDEILGSEGGLKISNDNIEVLVPADVLSFDTSGSIVPDVGIFWNRTSCVPTGEPASDDTYGGSSSYLDSFNIPLLEQAVGKPDGHSIELGNIQDFDYDDNYDYKDIPVPNEYVTVAFENGAYVPHLRNECEIWIREQDAFGKGDIWRKAVDGELRYSLSLETTSGEGVSTPIPVVPYSVTMRVYGDVDYLDDVDTRRGMYASAVLKRDSAYDGTNRKRIPEIVSWDGDCNASGVGNSTRMLSMLNAYGGISGSIYYGDFSNEVSNIKYGTSSWVFVATQDTTTTTQFGLRSETSPLRYVSLDKVKAQNPDAVFKKGSTTIQDADLPSYSILMVDKNVHDSTGADLGAVFHNIAIICLRVDEMSGSASLGSIGTASGLLSDAIPFRYVSDDDREYVPVSGSGQQRFTRQNVLMFIIGN